MRFFYNKSKSRGLGLAMQPVKRFKISNEKRVEVWWAIVSLNKLNLHFHIRSKNQSIALKQRALCLPQSLIKSILFDATVIYFTLLKKWGGVLCIWISLIIQTNAKTTKFFFVTASFIRKNKNHAGRYMQCQTNCWMVSTFDSYSAKKDKDHQVRSPGE